MLIESKPVVTATLALLLSLLLSGAAPADGVAPFVDLGNGLPGNFGLVPELTGVGTLVPGDDVTLTVVKSAKSSMAYLVVGTAADYTPLLGGTLVPRPRLFIGPLQTRKGTVVLSADWLANMPAGTSAFLQFWILDGSAVQGYSASNGLMVTP